MQFGQVVFEKYRRVTHKNYRRVTPINIQPVVVMRGLKRQQGAALTNFVGCFFLLYLISFFSS